MTDIILTRLRECADLVKLVAIGDATAAVDLCQRVHATCNELAIRRMRIEALEAALKKIGTPEAVAALANAAGYVNLTPWPSEESKQQQQTINNLAQRAWQEMLDKDDRTSPAEYPDHVLITRMELDEYLLGAYAEGLTR